MEDHFVNNQGFLYSFWLSFLIILFDTHLIDQEWDVMVDLFFYRKLEEIEEEQLAVKEDEGRDAGRDNKNWDKVENNEEQEEDEWNDNNWVWLDEEKNLTILRIQK